MLHRKRTSCVDDVPVQEGSRKRLWSASVKTPQSSRDSGLRSSHHNSHTLYTPSADTVCHTRERPEDKEFFLANQAESNKEYCVTQLK